MYDASFSLESRHWWGAYQMSPIMSKSMKVTSGGSEHSIVGKWRHVKFRKKALPEIWCWILFLMIIFAVKSVISCILFNKDFVSVFCSSLYFLWRALQENEEVAKLLMTGPPGCKSYSVWSLSMSLASCYSIYLLLLIVLSQGQIQLSKWIAEAWEFDL